jgi:hypothetical protein
MIMYGDLEKTGRESVLAYVKIKMVWHTPGNV